MLDFALQISVERGIELSIKWPEEWTGAPFDVIDVTPTTLVPVERGTNEWNAVQNEWASVGHPDNGFSAELLRVERVQNVLAWQAYYSRVQLLASRNTAKNPVGKSIFAKANEKWLKHGTRTTDPKIIYSADQGLDFRYSGLGLFGIAAYSAEDAKYSHGYSFTSGVDASGGTTNQMFLVRVAAGKVFEVATRTEEHRKLVVPPVGFDSVLGYVSAKHKAIMVYQTDSAYPAYLLTYRSIEKK